MSTNQTDVVGEYLREVEFRLSALPLLQRRELLADLHAHIEEARAERGANSQGELIEILERLGSPDVVAAAAYDEAGPFRSATPAAPATKRRPPWLGWAIAAAIVAAVVMILGCVGLMFFAGSSATSEPASVEIVTPVPAPART